MLRAAASMSDRDLAAVRASLLSYRVTTGGIGDGARRILAQKGFLSRDIHAFEALAGAGKKFSSICINPNSDCHFTAFINGKGSVTVFTDSLPVALVVLSSDVLLATLEPRAGLFKDINIRANLGQFDDPTGWLNATSRNINIRVHNDPRKAEAEAVAAFETAFIIRDSRGRVVPQKA